MIEYINTISGITSDHLIGFFVGWSNPPSPEKHLKILEKSSYIWLAVDNDTKKVVGFVTAINK